MFYLFIFIFGACMGSFLNCVTYRLAPHHFYFKSGGGLKGRPRRKAFGFLRGRSFCPECHHKLGWLDLIPILSFIFLKGKCRYCGEKISWQYPAVEIATGALFLLIFNFFTPLDNFTSNGASFSIFNLIYYFIIGSLLIIIFVYDLKHYIILDKVIYPAIIVSLIFNFQKTTFCSSLLSGVGAASFFFLIWLVSRGRWMGLGDAKLAFFMGLFLGFPNILVGLFSAVFIGAIIGLGLIALGKKTLKSQVPFGPFLVIGTFIALFWGKEIINWYFNLI